MHVFGIFQLLLLLGFYGFKMAAATPIPSQSTSTTAVAPPSSALMNRAAPAPPHFLVYIQNNIADNAQGLPPVNKLEGFNVVALAFLFSNGTTSQYSQAWQWQQMNASARSTVKTAYAAAGIKIIVSLGGSTDLPTSTGVDPKKAGTTAAQWVKDNNLDGIDLDYEDFPAMSQGTGGQWIIDFTTQLRSDLGSNYLITHAPVAAWFAPNVPGGGYRAVDKAVGNMIDWYNIQFYNSAGQDSTCDNLLNTANTSTPGQPTQTSLFEINADAGVPLAKIVLGKPQSWADSQIGVMNSTYLATCVQQASQKGWNGGIMVWQYSDTVSAFIQSARKLAFPML